MAPSCIVRKAALAGLLAQTACAHPQPRTALFDESPHLLGALVQVSAAWNDSCRDWSAELVSMKSGGSPGTISCHEKAFRLELACEPRCAQPEKDESFPEHSLVATVIPLEVGRLTLTASSTRTDTGETHKVVFPPLLIVLPDRLALTCDSSDGYAPCGPDGVSAAKPLLAVETFIGERAEYTTALRINGMSLPVPRGFARDARFSLADIFPEHRVGDGVAPGTYMLTIEVGTVISRWQVTAKAEVAK